MNASKFMDKQIMDLSRSKSDPNYNDFTDLMNPQSEDDNTSTTTTSTANTTLDGGSLKNNYINIKKKDEEVIMASYDFQPIIPRPHSLSSSSSPAADSTTPAAPRSWNSLDHSNSAPTITPLRSYGSVDPVEPEKAVLEKNQKVNDSLVLSDIDRTMKKYTDSVLHAIDSLSSRLSQLESRTRSVEYSVDELKLSVGNNHGNADGKLRQLENILLEVQSGVQDIRDKQEVMDGHMQLAKLHISKVEKSSETPNSVHIEPAQQVASAPPHQSNLQQLPVAAAQTVPSLSLNAPPPPQQNHYTAATNIPQSVPSFSPNVPPPSQQAIHPPPSGATQYPPGQIPHGGHQDAYYSPGQTQEAPSQQYQMPPAAHQQQPSAAAPPPPQQYQLAPTPPYPQPPQPPQLQHATVAGPNAPQFQPASGHHLEETPYMPSQSYPPPNLRQPTSQPSSGPPQSQQYYGSPSPMYEPSPPNRSSSGFSSAYGPPTGPSEPYPYGGPSAHYASGSSMKPQPHSPGRGGNSGNYPQIPTARVLPQATSTTAASSGGTSSGGSGNKVPIDDVIDKVTTMGFPREHVRATVRKLTENGQSVDLNIVLDKLMNDGDVQPPKGGWFGR